MLPKSGANQREYPGEAADPARNPGLEAQQQIAKQGTPNLPAHSISTVAQKVSQLESLFNLLEEDFDFPAGAIEIGHAAGTPIHVVGEELHLTLDAIDLYECPHAAHAFGVFALEGTVGGEYNFLVSQNLRIADLAAFDHFEAMAGFRAGDPEDSPKEKIEEMIEIHIGLVEKHNLPGQHGGADLPGPLGVVVTRGVDEDKTGKETLEIQSQMAFGGGFAAAMFGPVHAPSNQLYGRRVDNMDGSAKAVRYAPPPASVPESRRERLKMREHRPKELFSQFRFANLASMREPVAARRRRCTNCRKRPAVKSQCITNIIKADGMSQLSVKHRDHMTPRRIRPAELFHPCLPGQLWHKMRWNGIAELAQNREVRCRWAGLFLFFHNLPHGRLKAPRPSYLQLFQHSYGMAVILVC